jgi:hypothetical protein
MVANSIKTNSAAARVHRVSDIVNIGFLVLVVALIALAIILIPREKEFQKAAEIQRAQEISNENKEYCEKWGMKVGSHEHNLCTIDLNEIRARQDKRTTAEMGFL